MATGIPYLDETWNPIAGCTKCSPGCENCWAEKMMYRQVCIGCARHEKNPDSNEDAWIAYSEVMDEDTHKWNGEISLRYDQLDKPLHWCKPRRIGVQFMGDLFHPKVPFEFIDRVFDTMFTASQHQYLILTKRPKKMAEYVKHLDEVCYEVGDPICWSDQPNEHIHLGVSVCNHKEMWKGRKLLEIPAIHKWISFEPLLAGVSSKQLLYYLQEKGGIDWVVVGCESLPGGRAGRFQDGFIEAARDIVGQCKAAGVPPYVKQIPINGKVSHNPKEWPEDLRQRELICR